MKKNLNYTMLLPFQCNIKEKFAIIFVLFLISAKVTLTNKVNLTNKLLLEAASDFAILIKDANITNLRIFGPTNISFLDEDLVDIFEFVVDKSSMKQISSVFLR